MKTAHSLAVLAVAGSMLIGCAQTQVAPPASSRNGGYATPQVVGQSPAMIDTSVSSEQSISGPEPVTPPGLGTKGPDGTELDLQATDLSVGYLNGRILEYNKKLETWKKLDAKSLVASLDQQQTQAMVDCFRDLQQLLGGYQSLRDQLLGRTLNQPTLGPLDIIDLQKKDISFIEGVCGRSLASEDAAVGQIIGGGGNAGRMQAAIADYYAEGAYEEVVQAWSQIPDQQQDDLDLHTTLNYADALIYLDRPDQAAEVYRKIVERVSGSGKQSTDLLSLRKKLADLYTASGDFFDAQTQYEQLAADYQTVGVMGEWTRLQLLVLERSMKGSPELTDYSELLRAYLAYVPQKNGYTVIWKAEEFLQQYPYSPVSANVDLIKEQSTISADGWFYGAIAQADQLIEEKKFQEALDLLQAIPEQNLAPERLQQLKERLDELILVEAVDRETSKIEQMQGLQRSWNEAVALAESGDIDGAIVVYQGLLDGEFSAKAKEKISELSNQAARDERRKAADLFIRSTKTADVESRKEMLIESRQVLKDILVKYPDVDISDKVSGNIQMVEKKMNELDPMLLPAIQQQEMERARKQESAELIPDDKDPFNISSPATPASLLPSPGPPLPSPGPPLPVLIPQAIQ